MRGIAGAVSFVDRVAPFTPSDVNAMRDTRRHRGRDGCGTWVPFLDHKVVELALGIPEGVKTRHGVLKYILKGSVRNLVP